MNGFDFSNDTILISGAAAGIGRAIADRLADAGAKLALLGRDAEGVSQAAESIGPAASAFVGDLSDGAAIDALVGSAWEAVGPITGLVNCAGIFPNTPMLDVAVEEWTRVLDTNLRAPFLVAQAVARRMIANEIQGAIVNISSSAAILARPGIPHYGASKAGVEQLTRNMAIELAPHGIRVNAVAPGLIATDRVMAKAAGAGKTEHAAKTARIPLRREGRPDEIAGLVLVMLSPLASYCTGSVLLADGGFTLGIPSY
ncbi:MAG: SDR family oxidoreductase [Alphaproteobacteria bacterium]|nr:SDR family oxidoreductase [Alphaproteobacteria bacterium]